jgi:hypothetical protein
MKSGYYTADGRFISQNKEPFIGVFGLQRVKDCDNKLAQRDDEWKIKMTQLSNDKDNECNTKLTNVNNESNIRINDLTKKKDTECSDKLIELTTKKDEDCNKRMKEYDQTKETEYLEKIKLKETELLGRISEITLSKDTELTNKLKEKDTEWSNKLSEIETKKDNECSVKLNTKDTEWTNKISSMTTNNASNLQIKELKDLVDRLQKENVDLKKENGELKTKNNELNSRVSSLQNSTTLINDKLESIRHINNVMKIHHNYLIYVIREIVSIFENIINQIVKIMNIKDNISKIASHMIALSYGDNLVNEVISFGKNALLKTRTPHNFALFNEYHSEFDKLQKDHNNIKNIHIEAGLKEINNLIKEANNIQIGNNISIEDFSDLNKLLFNYRGIFTQDAKESMKINTQNVPQVNIKVDTNDRLLDSFKNCVNQNIKNLVNMSKGADPKSLISQEDIIKNVYIELLQRVFIKPASSVFPMVIDEINKSEILINPIIADVSKIITDCYNQQLLPLMKPINKFSLITVTSPPTQPIKRNINTIDILRGSVKSNKTLCPINPNDKISEACFGEIWREICPRNYTESGQWDNWKKNATYKQLQEDVNKWGSIESSRHRHGCYGPVIGFTENNYKGKLILEDRLTDRTAVINLGSELKSLLIENGYVVTIRGISNNREITVSYDKPQNISFQRIMEIRISKK